MYLPRHFRESRLEVLHDFIDRHPLGMLVSSVDGKVVPTWNYSVVQARGRILFHDDEAWLHTLVSRLTDRFERDRPEPWAVADAPEDYLRAMLRAIVGFEIVLTELVGKFKASQNKSAEARAGVREALHAAGAGDLDELLRDPG